MKELILAHKYERDRLLKGIYVPRSTLNKAIKSLLEKKSSVEGERRFLSGK